MLTFRVLEFDHYARILIELYLIYRYTVLVTGSFSLFNLLLFIILFTSGLLIFYSIFFAFSATNVWFIKLENLHHLFDSIKDIGKRPVDIFKNRLLLFFSYFLPVGYIATFPAKALLGEISFFKVVMGPVLTIVFFFLSQKFFKFALKHYSSASS
jgi:ABC-2 type transport system permease protein